MITSGSGAANDKHDSMNAQNDLLITVYIQQTFLSIFSVYLLKEPGGIFPGSFPDGKA